jgi:hypothetical protein
MITSMILGIQQLSSGTTKIWSRSCLESVACAFFCTYRPSRAVFYTSTSSKVLLLVEWQQSQMKGRGAHPEYVHAMLFWGPWLDDRPECTVLVSDSNIAFFILLSNNITFFTAELKSYTILQFEVARSVPSWLEVSACELVSSMSPHVEVVAAFMTAKAVNVRIMRRGWQCLFS